MRYALMPIALFAGAPAFAQIAPPPGNVEQRSREQLRTPDERARTDALMTGDSDIILLRRTPLFTLTGAAEISYTSNAALSPANARADELSQLQFGVGIGTRIGGKVDVFANAAIVDVRYFNNPGLNYNAFSGVVGARADFGRVTVSATYQPSVVFAGDFGPRQLTSHRLRLGVSLPFSVRGVRIDPEIHGERAITTPGDFTAWSGGGSLTFSAIPFKKKPVIAFVQVGYDRRSFDNYFEAFIGTPRDDDNLSASAGVVWRPRSWGEVRASYSFGRNWSTSDLNGYTAHTGSFGLSAALRF